MRVTGMYGVLLALWVVVIMAATVRPEDKMSTDKDAVAKLAKMLMMQSFRNEEETRCSGNSGIKHTRVTRQGTRPYQTASYVDNNIQAIHNHQHNKLTMGMGEVEVVLNGVSFRTRHNDYMLKMKHRKSNVYNKTEDIPFPGVPPAVLAQSSLDGQITEMREWFRAWKNQRTSPRDYREYFKPVLCYMEGAWTHVDPDGPIDEPFESDRHYLNKVPSWEALEDLVRFMGVSGHKERFENLAYLPTKIAYIDGGVPVTVQWNYRILCHPLEGDLPFNKLRPVVDEKSLMAMGLTWDSYNKSRVARYQIVPDQDNYEEVGRTELDVLMEQIPGYDNYDAWLTDTIITDNSTAYQYHQYSKKRNKQKLNAAQYSRYYSAMEVGAMRSRKRHRGFCDETLFAAMTTQSKVAGITGKRKEAKYTYAIPLEIVYLTPLVEWNPLGIAYKGDADSDGGLWVFGADGSLDGTKHKPLNGSNSEWFYRTPVEFYHKTQDTFDKDDGASDIVSVRDAKGAVHQVRSSGHSVFLSTIPGVGRLRQRYPIAPMHVEGDSTWKELTALTDRLYAENAELRDDVSTLKTELNRLAGNIELLANNMFSGRDAQDGQ